MNTTLKLFFGPASDRLEIQLKKQGYKFKKVTVDHFQGDINALVRLHMRGYLDDAGNQKVVDILFKAIENHVKQMNHLTNSIF